MNSPRMTLTYVPDRFSNIKKIGYGSYGIVYSAYDTIAKRPVAIKRNIINNPTEMGISTIREAEVLTRIRGSPFVIELIGFIPNSEIVFPMENLRKIFSRHAVDDKFHFIQPLADYNLTDAFKMYRPKIIPIKHIKHFTLNILLGLDWLHKKDIIHRDLSPSNILVCKTSNTLKICDFGMCSNKTAIEPKTPGVVTSWYRAPEISIREKYTEKIDMWALGAIMFEMIAGKALFQNQSDNSISLIKHYFKLFPFQASRRIFEKLYQTDKIEMFCNIMENADNEEINIDDNNFSSEQVLILTIKKLKTLSKVNEYYKNLTNKDELFMDNFFSLMAKLVSLDPSVRPSARECIAETVSLFEEYSPYIKSQFSVMELEESKNSSNKIVKFHTLGNYRLKAYKMFVALYNQSSRIPWYTHRVLFHAIDLFEIFIAETMSSCNQNRIPANILQSMVINTNSSDYDIYIKVYTCLYIFHKIFVTLEDPFEWKRFTPKEFSTPANIIAAESFELFLFANIAKCKLYRPTLYELIVEREGRESKALIKKCIQSLVNLDFVDNDDAIDKDGNVYFTSYDEIFSRIAG